jgi:hypothetical protein
MTGLVPVIHVVKPETLRIGRKRSRVDGRDKPGHDGKGRVLAAAFSERGYSRPRPIQFGKLKTRVEMK